jgi:hypothetical protein
MAVIESVEISTSIFFILSSVLSIYITKSYLVKRQRNYLYWSIGMWVFALSDLFEVFFAFGAYGQLMAQVYLFLIALLVVPLAMGSLELTKSRIVKISYFAYSVITVLFLAYYTFTTNVGKIVTNSVVNGNVPSSILLWSSAITFPALVAIVAVAALSYIRTRRKKVLWIIAGMITFAAGGVLYIGSFPSSIYYTEFLGLVMLWLGFFDFSILKKS